MFGGLLYPPHVTRTGFPLTMKYVWTGDLVWDAYIDFDRLGYNIYINELTKILNASGVNTAPMQKDPTTRIHIGVGHPIIFPRYYKSRGLPNAY